MKFNHFNFTKIKIWSNVLVLIFSPKIYTIFVGNIHKLNYCNWSAVN